jgi:Ca2+-binding RTX toxin-like protein
MRTISLTAVALLGAALLAPVGTAAAAGESCQGQAATIVGTPGGQITGTEGADVIVTNDATRVDALGGDDLVCATGKGSGYDSATGTFTFVVILGAGADTFIPSERSGSTIYAGTVDGTDTEADVIRLSGMAGLVISGMPGQPNADIIDLGDSGDVRWSGIQTAPGAVSAVGYSIGTGSLSVRSAKGDVTMDASGTVTGVDTALTWTGRFGQLGFTTSAKYGRFTFRGTDRSEHIKVNAPTTYDRDIALGSGNDLYESNSLGGKATRIKGDIGRNTLLLDLKSHDRVRADLSRSRVTATKAGVTDSIRVSDFNGLAVAAKRAVVIGTDRTDYIRVAACRTTLKGMKGGDNLYVDYKLKSYGADSLTPPRCSDYEATIDGGHGNDFITGNYGDDRLIGGPGNDSVWGGKGRDVCQGETIRGCEKRI